MKDFSIAGQAVRSMHKAKQRLCKTRRITAIKEGQTEDDGGYKAGIQINEHVRRCSPLFARKSMDTYLSKKSFKRKASRPKLPTASGLS